MGYASQMAAAALEAQTVLAKLCGMSESADGNTLYRGRVITGVYGMPMVTEDMNLAGGYRKRTEVPLSLTKAQLLTPPKPKEQIIRTDLDEPITYRIDSVDTHGPHSYELRLVKVGE